MLTRLSLAACVLWPIAVNAAPTRLPGARALVPPTIDGVVNDSEWLHASRFEGLQDSVSGDPYPDKGEFWLSYDRSYIYFAARFHEQDPKLVRATEYRTNVSLGGDDYVELDLDLSGSLSAFNRFQINPRGATNIGIAGGRAAKREWLGSIVAKGNVTATGWEVEARIPWSGMDIPSGGKRNLRLNCLRFVSRNNRTLIWTYVPKTDTGATPTWLDVELPKPSVDRSVKLLPYGYAGHDPKVGGVFNAGLDLKTSLMDQVKLVGSINPDFRNIENQVLSLDFSRFERLAGETRPFFQEGAEYSNSQLFASQRITGFDAGVNTYGRISDKLSFSFIDAVDFGHSNASVLNLTNDPGPNTSIRFTVADLEKPGVTNRSYLVRLSQNFGDYNLFLRNMASKDSALGFGQQFDVNLTWIKGAFAASGGWTHADENFRPRLGFVQEVDVQGPFLAFEFNKNFNKGPIKDAHVEAVVLSYDHIDSTFYRKEAGAAANTTLSSGLNVAVGADLQDFEGSKDSLYSIRLTYPRGSRYKFVQIGADSGRQAGAPYKSYLLSSAYRIAKGFQLTLRAQHVDYLGSSDQLIASANYDLGHDRSVSGRVVRQGKDTNAYVAFQRSGNEGIEYFLILGDPNADKFRASLILKVVVPFTLGKRSSGSANRTVLSSLDGTPHS